MTRSMASRPSIPSDSAPWGSQLPRIEHVPPFVSSMGVEAVYLAGMAGLILDLWQERTLIASLGVGADKRWAAFEVGVCVSRQNGKGALLEARELAGLFLLNERLIIHSAHLFDTSLEHFERIVGRIEDTPQLSKRIARNGISRGSGKEAIRLKTGQRLKFRARSSKGGRGWSADLVVLDEAMDCPEAVIGAMMPTLSARENPQLWMTGSAVDQEIQENGVAFARLRERGIEATDPALAYFEWSRPEEKPHEVLDPMTGWEEANPAINVRISPEHIAKEQRSMDPRTFAVERLGVGDWPRTDGLAGVPITPEAWDRCVDTRSKALDPVVFAFDVPPDRSSASIAVAGWRKDGKAHVEVIEKRKGKDWLPARMAELVAAHKPAAVVCDAIGGAATLIPDLEKLRVQILPLNSHEHAQACGLIFDFVDEQKLAHLGTPELKSAIQGADTRPLADAWAWSRKNSVGEISPLVAVTLALWGVQTIKPKRAVVGSLEDFLEDEPPES